VDPVSAVSDPAYLQSMMWGSYDTQMYFGLRTRTKRALHAGLMWYMPGTDIRHDCNHHEACGRGFVFPFLTAEC
jgi:hypothetical protein